MVSSFSSSTYDKNRCFGCQVLEGYGMTETSCVISCMDEGDNLSGHVGSPNPACGEFEFCYLGSISGNKLSCALDNRYISYIR